MSKILKGVAVAAVAVFAPYLLSFTPFMLGASAITALNAFAVSAFISGIAGQLAKRPQRPTTTVEYTGTVEPRRIIYGQIMAGGMHVIMAKGYGTNNKYMPKVLAIAGHEVNAMTAVYFNQVAVGTIGSVTGTTSDGLVSTGGYANKAWIRRYLGTSTQTADYILDTALTEWTSSHRGRGVAYVAIQFESDEKVYQNGVPEVTVLVQGMKVYDPRLDSTNGGSGAHRYATPSTWTYSNNPALCLANYLIDDVVGMGETAATRIDWAMVATAADECDENVTCPDGSGGSTTQKRYTCNAVFYATESYQSIISAIAGAMLGTCLYSGGKWRIMAGAWYSSAFTLGDSNFVAGGITLTTAYEYQERYNGIRGTFVDPANNYQPNEFPAVSNATYVTADGESVFKDVRFDACANVYEAQRAAILLVRKSRNRQSAVLSCDMSAWKIRPGETGIVTCSELGWSSKTVRCEGWKFNPGGYVEISVREELSSDWNDPVLGDYIEPLAISNVTPVYFTPDAPSGLTVSGSKNGVTFNWTAPGILPSGALYELYEYTANTPFSSASVVWTGIATTAFLPKNDTITRYYWIAIRMPWETGAVSGGHYPSGNGTAGQIGGILDFSYLTTGNCVVVDNSCVKVGGAAAWDSSVYSNQGYLNGAFVSFRPAQVNKDLMVGLNTDPTTDSSYTSLDYAWYMFGTTLNSYESGTGGPTYGTYAAGDDLSITYDGALVRYLQNGVVLREVMAGPGKKFYLDSSFRVAGVEATNIRFGPYGTAAPVQFNARGNCVVSDTNAGKVGGSAAWDSDVYSLKGYTTCHVAFKSNDATSNFMVGLNTDPLTDLSYTSIDYAFYCAAGTLYIYESGSSVASYGSYDTTTLFAITYDGSTVTYYKDGVSQRTVSVSSLTLYMDSSFHSTTAGINSLKFGPTTNLDVVDTTGLGDNAATTVLVDTYASLSLGSGYPITRNFPAAGTYELTVSGRLDCTAFTSQTLIAIWFSLSGTMTTYGDNYPVYTIHANGESIQVSQSLTVVLTGAGSWQVQIDAHAISGTATVTLSNISLRTTQIKK